VPVHACIFRELVGHDAAAGVEGEDVEAISLVADLLAGGGGGFPVGEVAGEPGDFFGRLVAEFLAHIVDGAVDGFLRDGDDEEFGEVLSQEGEAGAVADAFAAAGDDGDFAGLVGGFFEGESVFGFGEVVGWAAEVLGDGAFDGVYGWVSGEGAGP
jgi:hypothetical protein